MTERFAATALSKDHGGFRPRPLTCLGDAAEIGPPHSMKSSLDRAVPAEHSLRHLPRKWWEWDYICSAADTLGLLKGNSTALGLGVGEEVLIFHFANHCEKVIATDLYSSGTAWTEARFASTRQVLEASPIPFPEDRVVVENRDMRDTKVPAGSIDFIWSCSSIEHVQTLSDLLDVFREIHRALKPGGYAILTTEFCVTDNAYLLPGVNAWNGPLFNALVHALDGFEFIGDTDLSLNALHPGNAPTPRRYRPSAGVPGAWQGLVPHMRSGTMANPVGLSLIVPIAMTLRKKDTGSVSSWQDLAVPQAVRDYTDGLDLFFRKKNVAAETALQAALDAFSGDIQMQHLCWRFLLDAKARQGGMRDRQRFVASLKDFQAIVPDGPVQDDDCLAFLGYLFSECALLDEAIDTFEKCLRSPSIEITHLLETSTLYLNVCSRAGDPQRGLSTVTGIVEDLIAFGWPADDIRQGLTKHFKTRLDDRMRQDFSTVLTSAL